MSLRRALTLFCACLFCAAPALASPSADTDGQFILDKSTVISGEPIWMTFRLVNHGTVPVRFYEAVGRGSVQRSEYSIIARDTAGREYKPPVAMIISGMVRNVSVAPGEAYRQRLFLPDWLTLPRPGHYTLICTRAVSSGPSGMIESDLPFTILPPDKKALGLVIQNLTTQAQADDSTGRDEAAISLAAIPDPRIVPVLAALLARPNPPRRPSLTDSNQTEDSKYAAVAGLGHFPCHASAEALLAVMNGNDDDLRSAAGYALRQMHYADHVLPALRQERRSPSAATQIRALRAVAALQDPRGFAPLVNSLHDPVPAVRVEAAKGLGVLRDRRAVPVLKSHLTDPDLTLRLACIESLVPLKYPILTEWLTPIVRSYAYPGYEYPSLEAMLALRMDCDYRAAPALASCLDFDDPRPSHAYNFFLIYQMDACENGPKYYSQWINGGGDIPDALQNNRKVLAALKLWCQKQ